MRKVTRLAHGQCAKFDLPLNFRRKPRTLTIKKNNGWKLWGMGGRGQKSKNIYKRQACKKKNRRSSDEEKKKIRLQVIHTHLKKVDDGHKLKI